MATVGSRRKKTEQQKESGVSILRCPVHGDGGKESDFWGGGTLDKGQSVEDKIKMQRFVQTLCME